MVVERYQAGLVRLAAELRLDLEAATRQRSTLEQALALAPWGGDDPRLAVVALAIHHAYGALESAMERVALAFEGLPGRSDRWHQDLLQQMTLDLAGVRGPALSRETADQLRSMLRFRHFLRHAYAVTLDPAQLEATARDAVVATQASVDELDAFARLVHASAGAS